MNDLPIPEVLLVDLLDFVPERLACECIEHLAANTRVTQQLDRGALQATAPLGGFNQAILPVADLRPGKRTRSADVLLLGLVPGVQLDRIDARPNRARLVLPRRLRRLIGRPLR